MPIPPVSELPKLPALNDLETLQLRSYIVSIEKQLAAQGGNKQVYEINFESDGQDRGEPVNIPENIAAHIEAELVHYKYQWVPKSTGPQYNPDYYERAGLILRPK